MGKVLHLKKPRTFTTAESFIEEIRQEIFRNGRSYREIAQETGVGRSTITALASGKTRWPRPTTLFPLIEALGLGIRLEKKP